MKELKSGIEYFCVNLIILDIFLIHHVEFSFFDNYEICIDKEIIIEEPKSRNNFLGEFASCASPLKLHLINGLYPSASNHSLVR